MKGGCENSRVRISFDYERQDVELTGVCTTLFRFRTRYFFFNGDWHKNHEELGDAIICDGLFLASYFVSEPTGSLNGAGSLINFGNNWQAKTMKGRFFSHADKFRDHSERIKTKNLTVFPEVSLYTLAWVRSEHQIRPNSFVMVPEVKRLCSVYFTFSVMRQATSVLAVNPPEARDMILAWNPGPGT